MHKTHRNPAVLISLLCGLPALAASGQAHASAEILVLQRNTSEACSYDAVTGFTCVDFDDSTFYRGDGGDLDGDGYTDFVTYAHGTSGIEVCLNDGGVPVCTDLGLGRTLSVNLADYDADGDIDIISTQFKTINVCLNDGTASFTCADRYINNDTTYSQNPYKAFVGLELADLNGDAYPDLVAGGDTAIAGYGWEDIACLGDAAGGLTCTTTYADSRETADVEAVDIDGDGDDDIIYTDIYTSVNNRLSQVRVCENLGGGTSWSCDILGQIDREDRQFDYGGTAVADFDGDGIDDLFLASRGYESSSTTHESYSEICFGDGAGGFDCTEQVDSGVPVGSYSYLGFVSDPEAIDLDGDGDQDLVMAAGRYPGLATSGAIYCLNDGFGGFACDEFGTVDNYQFNVIVGSFTQPGDSGGGGASTDGDGDGVGDNSDPCEGYPNDDTDGDGVCDTSDVCPTDADDTDEDNDSVCDVVDVCVGADNVDTDGDQVCDSEDLCLGNDATGDEDADGICDGSDNCPGDANADQADADGDDIGDACESDVDTDGVIDDDDNCPDLANADQSDIDLDGAGDVCDADDDDDGVADDQDNCPFYDNADQADLDGDGYGDVCDGDDDADGVTDDLDLCPGTPLDAVFDSTGCSGPQRIEAECGEPDDYGWNRRGHYIACVAKESHSAWRSGLITRWEKAMLIRQATIDVWFSYIRRIRRWC